MVISDKCSAQVKYPRLLQPLRDHIKNFHIRLIRIVEAGCVNEDDTGNVSFAENLHGADLGGA